MVRVWICLSEEETPISAHAQRWDSANPARDMIRTQLCAHMNNLKLRRFNIPGDQDATQFALSLMPSVCRPYYGGLKNTPGKNMPRPDNFKKTIVGSFSGLLVLTFASLDQYADFRTYTEMSDDATYETTLTMFDHSKARWV